MGELRLPELGDRYNAAETYVDVHRAERPDVIAIRCQGKSVTYGEMAQNVDTEGAVAFAAQGGVAVPALWDGERLHAGRAAALALLETLPR